MSSGQCGASNLPQELHGLHPSNVIIARHIKVSKALWCEVKQFETKGIAAKSGSGVSLCLIDPVAPPTCSLSSEQERPLFLAVGCVRSPGRFMVSFHFKFIQLGLVEDSPRPEVVLNEQDVFSVNYGTRDVCMLVSMVVRSLEHIPCWAEMIPGSIILTAYHSHTVSVCSPLTVIK